MIITRLSGGMGNQMFQYALGRALALQHQTELGLDLHGLLDRTSRKGFTFRNYDLDLFSISASILSQSQIPRKYRRHSGKIGLILDQIRRKLFPRSGKEKTFSFDPEVLLLPNGTYLDGYWQSYKYFEPIADTIRADFTLKIPLPEHIEILRQKISTHTAVCIHVRRGDYVGNTLHDVVKPEHYNTALTILAEKTTIEHIYVFSDDIAWCKNNLSFAYPITFVDELYAGDRASGHFSLMRACAHFIIPNSTFSWWAAWLSTAQSKIVIIPKTWFNTESIVTDDMSPADWIRI